MRFHLSVVTRLKAVPVYGESGHEWSEWPKGEWLGAAKRREMFPLSRLAPTAPPQAVAPLTPSVNSLTLIATSLDREAFSVFPRSGESAAYLPPSLYTTSIYLSLLIFSHYCT